MIAEDVDPSKYVQGGALALLSLVLLVLWPRAHKEVREEREKRDARFVELVSIMEAKFDARNKSIVEALERQTAAIVAELKKDAK